ncbi:MAG: bifunctional (p)ppGpp synthetase/guanosine-3',5'-bis(diphosphate) 3'-pyrophosphohydrolase [Bacteroidales bacterium]|nr:bifunctional (p)ppGpp synthetase/guanosine-3',5'-bis(diphosphate) 3'-pyrophosphohydrolase [Bacteroidales bacterium]
MEKNDTILKAAAHVFDVMAPRVSAEDLQRIKDAFELALEAHEGQKRNTGEPYIVHPIAVATIAAEELELDANTVIAAFLHGVVEDTHFTLDDIRARFGDDVAFLVDVVTKRKKHNYEHTKQVDNYRQILESVHFDIRALLVKLSDRLHNMRTLDSMRPDKQMKIAGETDFFYAPLAGRLGLYYVKTEMENLSFRFRCPREFEQIERQLEDDRIRTAGTLKEFTDQINDIFKSIGIPARTEIRYRRPYSIWRDMREKHCDFSHVEFKHFVRIIYEPIQEWNRSQNAEKDTTLFIYSCLSSYFKERPGSVVNYIDNPKDNGYQSFHVQMLNKAGVWEELHIASERMHRNARLGCVVERDESWLERFKAVLQNIAESGDGYIFMDSVSSSLYNEDILAFTPGGKGIILPKGATALDFAFEVHSEIGEHAKFARINGALSPIKTELHRGDCVEIGTSEDVVPKREWLNYAKTYKARKRLHDLLRAGSVQEYTLCPECEPLPGEEVIGFKDVKGEITIHSRHCPQAIKLASENGNSLVSVAFDPDPSRTYPVKIKIVAIDRYHLLRDIIDCFVERQHLSMTQLSTYTEDEIVTCIIEFPVHSADELHLTMESISTIPGVDEVRRLSVNKEATR